MNKIYSTSSNDNVMPIYLDRKNKAETGPNTIKSAIIIKGGANVAFSASNKTQRNVKYAVTEVSDEDLKVLKSTPTFMRKVDRGFYTINKPPLNLIADKSAQITEKDMKNKNPGIEIKTGSVAN